MSKTKFNTVRFRHLTFGISVVALTCLVVFCVNTLRRSNAETLIAGISANNQPMPALSGEKAVEHLKQSGQYESLGAAMTAARYKIESRNGMPAANNPANSLRASFDDSGVQIQSAVKNESWQMHWRLVSVGYDDNQQTLPNGEMTTRSERVEIKHGDGLTEWYKNTPDGIEQGFDIAARNAGANADAPLRLRLTTDDWQADADADGRGLTLRQKDGAALRYENLKAWDANNQMLAAKMRTEKSGEVWLEVEDANAVYPITVDPTFARNAKTHGKRRRSE